MNQLDGIKQFTTVVNCLMPSSWFINDYSLEIKALAECVSSHF